MKAGMLVAAAALAAAAAAFAYVQLGVYDIAADEKHWGITERVLQTVRERSIAARSRDVGQVPNLEDPRLVSTGAGQYAEMCVECHLAPGRKDSPLRQGLYPQPPDLSLQKPEPRAAFWTIKHGIKMTGMPAWGASHDDATLWSLVAFLQKLPGMDAAVYEKMTAEAPPDEAMADMPGMQGAPGHRDAVPHPKAK